MTKIRKQKRRKNFQYNINRKRTHKKQFSILKSATENNEWNIFESTKKNFKKAGLAFDVNKDIRHLNRHATSNEDNLNVTSTSEMVLKFEEKPKPSKVKKKFSKEQVLLFKYLIEKYGDDYKSMARDNRNYLQHTWKQLRNKIKLFYATHQNCRFNSE